MPKEKNIMKTTIAVFMLIVSTMSFVGCSAESFVAKGYVISQTERGYSISIGSAKGIQIGDVLQVIRPANDKRTVIVGKVKVTKVTDEYLSTIELLEGTVRHGDQVEKWAK